MAGSSLAAAGPPPPLSHDEALYRGSLLRVVETKADEAIQSLCDAPNPMTSDLAPMSRSRAEAAVSARLVLRAASLLEGWGVALARWMLEAAATRRAQPGADSAFLETCAPSLDPSAYELLSWVRASGHASRANVSRAIGQCAAHHALWSILAAQTAAAAVTHGSTALAVNGIDEHTRLFWTPLHFAAAFDSREVVEGLLALHPRNVTVPNGVGFSPLHVAVAHGSLLSAAALAAAPHDDSPVLAATSAPHRSPLPTEVVDRLGRTPADLAAEVAPSTSRCRSLLAALGRVSTGASTRQARRACAHAAKFRKQRNAAVTASKPGPLPAACAGGGGWAEGSAESLAACESGEDDDEEEEEEAGDGGRPGRALAARSCEIPVADAISPSDLIHEFLVGGSPILVTAGSPSSALYSKWRRSSFLRAYGAVVVAPEPYPYAHASAYLYGVPSDNSTSLADLAGGRTQREVRHEARRHGVFNALTGWDRITFRGDGTDFRSAHGDITLRSTAADGPLPPMSSAARLLGDFERPPFLEDEQWLLRTNSVQFYLGDGGSGAQPHWHASSWNWLVHGHKRWFLWPPTEALYSQQHVEHTVGQQNATQLRQPGAPSTVRKALVCDQLPGEVIVVPELWGHATVNLQRSIGWASEFHFDRAMDDGLSATHGDEWWRTGERPHDERKAEPRARQRKAPMGVYG